MIHMTITVVNIMHSDCLDRMHYFFNVFGRILKFNDDVNFL